MKNLRSYLNGLKCKVCDLSRGHIPHVAVDVLPENLQPNTIYFEKSTGTIWYVDENGVPKRYGNKDFYSFELRGELWLSRKNIPSGNDRYTVYNSRNNGIPVWNWGNMDAFLGENGWYWNAATFHFKGWFLPPGYIFKKMRVIGGYTSNTIKYWSIYLLKSNQNRHHPRYNKGEIVEVFPIIMPLNERQTGYPDINMSFDISDKNIITQEDELYSILMLTDNPVQDDNTTMYIRNFILRFELEKL